MTSGSREFEGDLMAAPIKSDITLGILAGGRASRLGGLDKAWLERAGVPQVLRIARRFDAQVATVIVSANRDLSHYSEHGFTAVVDGLPDAGPIGGIDALTRTCRTPWLLTLPVDVVGVNECLLQTLGAEASATGVFAVDDDGPQPLVALWQADALREAIAAAIASRNFAVHVLQDQLGMTQVRFPGVRFGNLNTPADLLAAGIELMP
jgi:molybdopterin-guanine dinucleotide biosynthesis protein A